MEELLDNAKELFEYNREGHFFNAKLGIEREYQEQDMRIKQFLLYRDDIRDLAGLTISKMDSYLLITLLELGVCVQLLVEGVIHGAAGDRPQSWLLWLYVMNLAGSFLYLFLSSWFAMHASVAAHSFSVRLLTQFVRLPLPDKDQINAGRMYAADFEGKGIKDLLRVPVWKQQMEVMRAAMLDHSTEPSASFSSAVSDPDGTSSDLHPVAALKHIRVYRELQANWQAHDAYARACMGLGTYTLLDAVAYYSIGLFVGENHHPWPAFGCVGVLLTLAWMLIRLDLYFSNMKQLVVAFVLMMGPVITCISAVMFEVAKYHHVTEFHVGLVPVTFVLHAALIVQVALVARAEHTAPGQSGSAALPTRFRAVLYLDVFGWLGDPGSSAWMHEAQPEGTTARCPPRLRQQLRAECVALAAQIRFELEAWEQHELNSWELRNRASAPVEQAPHSPDEQLTEMRCELEDLVRQFTEADADLAVIDRRLTELTETKVIWLRLPWNQQVIFINPRSGEALSQPPSGDFVSDHDGLLRQLVILRERVDAMLYATAQPEPSISGGHSQSQSSTLLASTGGFFRSALVSLSSQSGTIPAAVEHQQSMAQETRFGGREAARTAEWGEQSNRTFFGHSEAAAQTFYPRRDGRRESPRPPGQVPWTTFFGASTVLVSVWMVGAVYYSFSTTADVVGSNAAPLEESARFPFLSSGERVHTRVSQAQGLIAPSFQGLACSAGLQSDDGEVLALVADKYAVYEIELPALMAWQSDHVAPGFERSAAVDACLAQAPADFQAHGLAGVSLQCSEDNALAAASSDVCVALLLGADGRRALRCPVRALHKERSRELSDVPPLAPLMVSLAHEPGRPWGALATRLGTSASQWWGLPSPNAEDPRQPTALDVRIVGSRTKRYARAVPTSKTSNDEKGTLLNWPARADDFPQRTSLRSNGSNDGASAASRRIPTSAIAGAANFWGGAPAIQGVVLGSRALHAHDATTLLGLSESGELLLSWLTPTSGSDTSAKDPRLMGAWRLPSSIQWSGLCSAGKNIYAVGSSTFGGQQIWRFDLPQAAVNGAAIQPLLSSV